MVHLLPKDELNQLYQDKINHVYLTRSHNTICFVTGCMYHPSIHVYVYLYYSCVQLRAYNVCECATKDESSSSNN